MPSANNYENYYAHLLANIFDNAEELGEQYFPHIFDFIIRSYAICVVKSGDQDKLTQKDFLKPLMVNAIDICLRSASIAPEEKETFLQASEATSDIINNSASTFINHFLQVTQKAIIDDIVTVLQNNPENNRYLEVAAELGMLAVILKKELNHSATIEELLKPINDIIEKKSKTENPPPLVALSMEYKRSLEGILR